MTIPNQKASKFFEDIHWLMDILQNIDVGLVVMDKNYHIMLWNSFMQNHSKKSPDDVLQHSIFAVFPELSKTWFKHKTQSVFVLQNTAFTTWEQRPYLFRFPHYRPITSTAAHMYQNSTIIPLVDANGDVEQICLIVYDVTDTAMSKMAQQQANTQLENLSRTDHLTRLYNRGYWELCLIKEFKRFDRYNQQSTLIMIDIDHFKKVNDQYGHIVGDDVIRQVGRALKEQVRELDIAGRYGGEEFGVVLTGTDAKGASIFAEKLRNMIEKMAVIAEGQHINFTISMGISQLTDNIGDYRQWIEKADAALYQSKEAGRNRFTIAS